MKQQVKEWMSRKNGTFSLIAGETITNREVVYTHLAVVAFILILGIAGNF